MTKEKIKTVVVDDENRIRRGIGRLVTSLGEEWEVVASFANGQELLEAYRDQAFAFDLLITDIKMPLMDGLTLIKELKKSVSFHAIVISGFDDFSYLQTAIREGAVDYLIKPIIREEFFERLQKVKEKIKIHRESQEKMNQYEVQINELTYVNQIERLRSITQNTDLSLLEWTKDFPKGDYTLLCISMDDLIYKANERTKANGDLIEKKIEQTMKEGLSTFKEENDWTNWIWRNDDYTLWVLILNNNKASLSFQEDVLYYSKHIQARVKKSTSYTVSIALSEVFHDLTALNGVKRELQTLLEFRLIKGNNKIYQIRFFEHFLKEEQTNALSKEITNSISLVIWAIERHNEGEIEHALLQFFQDCRKLTTPMEMKQAIYSLCCEILHTVQKQSPVNNMIEQTQDLVLRTERNNNFIELKEEIISWVHNCLSIGKGIEKEQDNKSQVEQAKQWIEAHLADNITIDKIAKQVFMNPTYFCEFFKNETGETVLDYVTRTRLVKAKELLLSTEFKVYEISEKVGYSDTKYFSKLFKKHFGELPTKYREKFSS